MRLVVRQLGGFLASAHDSVLRHDWTSSGHHWRQYLGGVTCFVSLLDRPGISWHDDRMTRRSRKPRDVNERAAAVVAQATSDEPHPDPYEGKNPAAVELGRLGGLKGGKARAEKLTAEERSAIARKAARARWDRESRRRSEGI